MAKGKSIKRDFVKSTDNLRTDEIDTPSEVDLGKDFVKAGEKALPKN